MQDRKIRQERNQLRKWKKNAQKVLEKVSDELIEIKQVLDLLDSDLASVNTSKVVEEIGKVLNRIKDLT